MPYPSGNLERRERFDEARGEAAQAAVAEAGFLLLREELVEVQPELGHALLDAFEDAEIHEVVAEMRPHQEFGREVGDRARAALGVGLRGADPALQHAVAHRECERHVVIVLGRERREFPLHVEQVVEEGVLQRFLAEGGAVVLELNLRFRR
jgi:hypothetical protein